MLRKVLIAVAVLVGLATFHGLGNADDGVAPPTVPATQPSTDLIVTLQHIGGKTEVFKDEIDRMELVLNATGRLDQVHLILRSGQEPDTHVWYNVNNLVSVRYQFLAITGKGKVSIRAAISPRVKEEPDEPRNILEPLDPDDYR